MKTVYIYSLAFALIISFTSKANPAGSPDSLLLIAARDGDIVTVRNRIDAGVDLNAQAKDGYTALSNAASRGHTAIVRLLLERGADISQALAYCEDLDEWFRRKQDMVAPGASRCIKILKRFKTEMEETKHQEQEIARAKAIEKQKAKEVKEIIKEVISETTKTQKRDANFSAIKSDIDRPTFIETEKIMGDDDLAVIIGIEGYQVVPKSDYSYDDAKLVADYAKAMGFKHRNIELLLDERATKSGIEKVIKTWLPNKAKPISKVFIYYSGHGAAEPNTGNTYLLPYDGDPNYLSDTGYSLKSFYDSLGKLQVAEVTVVIDACFSGSGGRSVLAKGTRPLVMVSDITAIPSNMAILSATQGSQISTSSPEKGHGIFTYYFLKALKDGKKTVSEIYDYIKPFIEDEAKTLNIQQSPNLSPEPENLKGRFSLRK